MEFDCKTPGGELRTGMWKNKRGKGEPQSLQRAAEVAESRGCDRAGGGIEAEGQIASWVAIAKAAVTRRTPKKCQSRRLAGRPARWKKVAGG
jgi:hypothetical protein